MSDGGWDRRLALAMRQAGWRYDEKTDGYRKAGQWVSRGQAEEALHAAEHNETMEPEPRSETVARVVAKGYVNGQA